MAGHWLRDARVRFRRRPARGTRRAATMAPILATLALAACTGGRPIGIPLRDDRFDSDLRRYARLERAKAMAIAGDVRGRYVSGVASGEGSVAAARSAALARCELRREDRRIDAPCRLVASNDDMTLPGPP